MPPPTESNVERAGLDTGGDIHESGAGGAEDDFGGGGVRHAARIPVAGGVPIGADRRGPGGLGGGGGSDEGRGDGERAGPTWYVRPMSVSSKSVRRLTGGNTVIDQPDLGVGPTA